MSTDDQPSFMPCRLLTRLARLPLLAVLVVLYLVFVIVIMPGSVDESSAGPLDLKFSYSPDTAYEMIESYGEEGRARYAISAMTADVAYPIVYTLMFAVWLSLAIKATKLSPNNQCLISMSPLLVFIFDMIENGGIVALLNTYPDRHDTLASLTSLATSAKWSAATVVILLTVTATVYSAWRRFVSLRRAG